MKTRKLATSFSFLLILFTSLVSKPMRANAGGGTTNGATAESSSYVGSSFSNGAGSSFTPFVPASGTDFSFDQDRGIIFSSEVEYRLQEVAANIINQADSGDSVLRGVLLGGCDLQDQRCDPKTKLAELNAKLSQLKISPKSAKKLVNFLQGLLTSKSTSSLPGISVAESKPVHLANGNGVNENNGKFNVDVNQLNDAINAYDKIVKQSNSDVVRQLAKDPQFLEIGNILKELRTALNVN